MKVTKQSQLSSVVKPASRICANRSGPSGKFWTVTRGGTMHVYLSKRMEAKVDAVCAEFNKAFEELATQVVIAFLVMGLEKAGFRKGGAK